MSKNKIEIQLFFENKGWSQAMAEWVPQWWCIKNWTQLHQGWLTLTNS